METLLALIEGLKETVLSAGAPLFDWITFLIFMGSFGTRRFPQSVGKGIACEIRLVGESQKAMTTTQKFLCSRQTHPLTFVKRANSFDKSLTFAFFSGTLFHSKATLLNESYYTALFVRSAASPNLFAAIHPRQNLLVPRSLFLFERLAAGVNGEQPQTLPFTFTLLYLVLKTCIGF